MKLNYRCVPSQKCDTRDDLSGPRDGVGTFTKTEDLFDQLGLADYAECPDLENGVCCHDEFVIPDNDCSSYVNDNYTCVKQTECLDAFLSSSDNELDVIVDLRGFDHSNPQLATCPPHSDGEPVKDYLFCFANMYLEKLGLVKLKSLLSIR